MVARRLSTCMSAATVIRQKMAAAIRMALAESKTPLSPPSPPAAPPAMDLAGAQLDEIIGAKGQVNGGVYQFTVPRRDAVTENGMTLSLKGLRAALDKMANAKS
jgi:Domain of Unknown Function (DUF1259)